MRRLCSGVIAAAVVSVLAPAGAAKDNPIVEQGEQRAAPQLVQYAQALRDKAGKLLRDHGGLRGVGRIVVPKIASGLGPFVYHLAKTALFQQPITPEEAGMTAYATAAIVYEVMAPRSPTAGPRGRRMLGTAARICGGTLVAGGAAHFLDAGLELLPDSGLAGTITGLVDKVPGGIGPTGAGVVYYGNQIYGRIKARRPEFFSRLKQQACAIGAGAVDRGKQIFGRIGFRRPVQPKERKKH